MSSSLQMPYNTVDQEEESNQFPTSFKPRVAFPAPIVKNQNKSENKELPSSFKPRSEIVKEQPEGMIKSAFRKGLQVPQAIAETTTPGLVASAWQLLAMGEILDPEEIEHIRTVSEREGIPFDEEKYMQAAQRALGTVPTVSNIASKVEEKTGLPLEPKTRLEKFVRFATGAGRMIPQQGAKTAISDIPHPGTTFRGMTTNLPRPVLGAGVGLAKEGLVEAGVPEPIAEIGAFGVLKTTPKGAGTLEFGQKTKPSGLPERGFEKLRTPREVSAKKLDQINTKVQADFEKLSQKIVAESPIGSTAKELLENPQYKQETRELLNQAQEIANKIPGEHPKELMQKTLYERAVQGKKQGYKVSEYDREYLNFVRQEMNAIKKDKFTAGDLVKTYRDNNRELGEMFELGSSKALNRAKRDAVLEHNRAIADVMEKLYPESELVPVFKEGNARWSKIMDAEVVDNLVTDIFKEGIDFKKAQQFFDKESNQRIFKRALGEEGFKKFEVLMNDLLKAEQSHKMLKVAKDIGFKDFYQSMAAYMFSPKLGAAKGALTTTKYLYRKLINSMLDKPQVMVKFSKSMENLKKGNFAQAEFEWKDVQKDLGKIETKPPYKPTPNEPILIPEKPKPSGTQPVGKTEQQKPQSAKQKTPQLLGEKPKEPIQEPTIVQPEKKITPETKRREVSQKIFSEIAEGSKAQKSQKDFLKETQVAILNTRGKGQQFHGTKNEIKNLDEDIFAKSSEQNIYGPGFYTTDALDIAQGYSNKKSPISGKVYSVKEKKPQKIYNAEKNIEEFEKWHLENQKKIFEYFKKVVEKKKENKEFLYDYDKKYETSFSQFIKEYKKNPDDLVGNVLFNEKPKSVRDLYDKIRDRAINEEMPAWQVQENFDQIQRILEQKGYQGISHKGGLLTNNPEHLVKIYWEPKNLEIQEFFYPKQFKKTQKLKEKIPEVKKTSKTEEVKKAVEQVENKIEKVKRQDISKEGLKKQKLYLMDKITEVLDNPDKFKGQAKIEIKVPDDGEFKLNNKPEVLEKLLKKIDKGWPDKPMREGTRKKYPEYQESDLKPSELKRQEYLDKIEAERKKAKKKK
jgi:hypothetical protein